MTKMLMARVITRTLFNRAILPAEDNWKVKQLMKLKKAELTDIYDLALAALAARRLV